MLLCEPASFDTERAFAVTILVQRKGCVCRSTERTSIAARMAAGKRGISLCACRTERQSTSLSIFGVIASTIIYGGIMNPASALMWSNTINWKIILSYYVTGLPVDLVRAIATFFFLWLIAEPMLEKLDRIKTKYGLAE